MTENHSAGPEWEAYEAGEDASLCCPFDAGELWRGEEKPAAKAHGFPVTAVLQYRVSGTVWLRAAKSSRQGALFVIDRN